ncbi:androgen-dependent TFPI-regulating protein isoform X2 [Tupaia chinensis]|uniref:androgen-dependent TFPI-regulating protein isoform X2 n=1 Tax=Tupaia chinensis TaxID=246437 RepID=UPI0003C91A4B|nr:androgen-dependent TFPI-regulating protein isoform X2 [Tupaia chinensis]
MKISICIYHFLVLSWYIFLNCHVPQLGIEKEDLKFTLKGGHRKYLTLLNLLLQAIFFGVACLDDVLKIIKGKKDIKFLTAFRDLLFTTLAFPISTFVFSAFWGLFLYNRDLIYPKILDGILPMWANHAMHTLIFPLSLAEVFLTPHRYPSRKTGFTILGISGLAYIIRILWLHSETGQWVYPVFEKLSPVVLMAFFCLSYVFSAGLYLLGEKLSHWKWGDMIQLQKKRK